jgi:Flp pilus assembly protein TadD/predicted Zn-dependent protease
MKNKRDTGGNMFSQPIARLAATFFLAQFVYQYSAMAIDYVKVPPGVSIELVKEFNDAVALMQVDKYAEASPKLEDVCSKTKNFAAALSDYGMCLLKLGNADKANEVLTEAYALDPNIPNILINLASARQLTNHAEDAVALLQEYIKKFPQGQFVSDAKNLVAGMQREIDSHKGINIPDGTDDYIGQTTTNGIMRWDSMPIAVYIASGRGLEGYKSSFNDTLKLAFKEWQDAANGKVAFNFVNDENNADLICAWTDDPNKLANAMEGGQAIVQKYPNGSIGQGHITILTKTPANRIVNQEDFLLHICLHEIGHALGLAHSNQRGDIMFAFMGSALDKPSARDANTVQKLYSLPVTQAEEPLSGNSVLSPPRRTTQATIAVYNQAVMSMQAKNFAVAETKFEQVCKESPNFAEAYANRGVCLARLEKTEGALEQLNKAYAINPRTPITLLNLGVVYERLGKPDLAARYYREYLQDYPNGLQTSKVKDILARLQH